ncbi:auxin-responsive protein SAUR72 [Quercus suber]|uniref:Auxin-responsive protein saur72 n=1 Tax=Quercus suber TaxID=58331 RepID=A0AAW0JBS8_QUESU|nr:auxin-responsive protein SAUR72-like [Quercus suber]POE67628.1 auxin-responsive protein saur72 [Quercus suber]
MRKLISKLSRVADSSQYALLRSADTRRVANAHAPQQHPSSRRASSFRAKLSRRRSSSSSSSASVVPEGHVPVYVGDEMERFVISAELLNHPVFVNLLNKSAQEYGYDQKGALRIPCHVLVFERVLEALRLGHDHSRDLLDLLNSLSSTEDFY